MEDFVKRPFTERCLQLKDVLAASVSLKRLNISSLTAQITSSSNALSLIFFSSFLSAILQSGLLNLAR